MNLDHVEILRYAIVTRSDELMKGLVAITILAAIQTMLLGLIAWKLWNP